VLLPQPKWEDIVTFPPKRIGFFFHHGGRSERVSRPPLSSFLSRPGFLTPPKNVPPPFTTPSHPTPFPSTRPGALIRGFFHCENRGQCRFFPWDVRFPLILTVQLGDVAPPLPPIGSGPSLFEPSFFPPLFKHLPFFLGASSFASFWVCAFLTADPLDPRFNRPRYVIPPVSRCPRPWTPPG